MVLQYNRRSVLNQLNLHVPFQDLAYNDNKQFRKSMNWSVWQKPDMKIQLKFRFYRDALDSIFL